MTSFRRRRRRPRGPGRHDQVRHDSAGITEDQAALQAEFAQLYADLKANKLTSSP